MKICILTQPLHTNYGGLLQAFALQKVLRDMGHDVVTDSKGAIRPMRFHKRVVYFCYHFLKLYVFGNKRSNPYRFLFTSLDKVPERKAKLGVNTDRFIQQQIATADFFKGGSKPSGEETQKYDAFVVGSDQVWRKAYSYIPAYFLDFAKDVAVKKLSYAASFGKDDITEYTPDDLAQSKALSPLFDAISVREDSGVKLCREQLAVEATHVLDPTLLLEKEDYLTTIEDEDKAERSKVLMCYVLDKSEDKKAIIKQFTECLSLTALEVMPKKTFSPAVEGDLTDYIFPSVSKWIAGFRDAEFVVTDSFHGTVFAIIFNKPFVAIANKDRGASRFISLLKIFGLEHRLISSIDDIKEKHFEAIDFEQVNITRKCWQEKSMTFLTKILK